MASREVFEGGIRAGTGAASTRILFVTTVATQGSRTC